MQPRRIAGHEQHTGLNRKSALAMSVCQLLVLSLDAFFDICEEYPRFFYELRHLEEEISKRDTATVKGSPSGVSSFSGASGWDSERLSRYSQTSGMSALNNRSSAYSQNM